MPTSPKLKASGTNLVALGGAALVSDEQSAQPLKQRQRSDEDDAADEDA